MRKRVLIASRSLTPFRLVKLPGLLSDESSPVSKGKIRPSPLAEDEELISKSHQINNVNENPNEPGEKACELHSKA